jgi:hypothetical protein
MRIMEGGVLGDHRRGETVRFEVDGPGTPS